MKANRGKGGMGTPSKKEISSTGNGNMEDSAFHMLFINELKDIYWAEKQLVKVMPKWPTKAYSDELKEAIEQHTHETNDQVTRLEKFFEKLNEKPTARKCEALEGILRETDQLVDETPEQSLVRDVAIISCFQKIEHYEIASYGTLRTMAQVMNHYEAEELLSATLDEEKNADSTLTAIAKNFVNEPAKEERR
jgi:ferritin-like metal-binding protein YciE